MNFTKFLRTPFIIKHLWWLVLSLITFLRKRKICQKNSRSTRSMADVKWGNLLWIHFVLMQWRWVAGVFEEKGRWQDVILIFLFRCKYLPPFFNIDNKIKLSNCQWTYGELFSTVTTLILVILNKSPRGGYCAIF